MPEADSMKAAMGEVPIRLPTTLDRPSTQNANVWRGNCLCSLTNPARARVSQGSSGGSPA
jgi:hypothetical protein